MKPSILVCGKSGAGKTSLIQAITQYGVVPDDDIGHSEPTTKGFVVYETEVANFIDCEGFEPGKMTISQYTDFILTEIQNRVDSGVADQVITNVLYCIDGCGARTQKGDISLIKSFDKKVMLVITKAEIMRKEQVESINKTLAQVVKNENIFMVSSHKGTGLTRLLNAILGMAESAEDIADDELMTYKKRWKEYYAQKFNMWEKMLSDEADSFIYWATGRAAAIAVIPLPLADVAPLIANELYMIYKLGNIYGYVVAEQIITMLTGVAGGSLTGKLLASFLPGLKIPIAAGVTYGVGKAVKAYFASGMKLNEAELKEKFKEAEREAKKIDWEKEAQKE